MQTARLIYISIGVLIILPLIAFNAKRFKIRKEGENSRLNIKSIILISLASLIIGVFIFTHYKFTIDYQPQLVLERFVSSYSEVESGRIKQADFLEKTKNLCSPGLLSSLTEHLESGQNKTENQVRFQLGEIIYPKNYMEQDIFPTVKDAEKEAQRPIYILAMIEFDKTRKEYIALMDIDNNKWFIDSFEEASEEIVEYANRYKFMKSEHANKWFDIK